MVAVTLTKQRIFFAWNVGRGMGQGFHQTQTNHIARCFVGRHHPAHILDGGLNTANDDLG